MANDNDKEKIVPSEGEEQMPASGEDNNKNTNEYDEMIKKVFKNVNIITKTAEEIINAIDKKRAVDAEINYYENLLSKNNTPEKPTLQ